MPAKPSYQVYLSREEKQRIREDSAKAGFTSISDYFRFRAGLPTREEQRQARAQAAALEQKRMEAAQIVENTHRRNDEG